MFNQIMRRMVQMANRRVNALPHLTLVDGTPKHLANRLRDRQEKRQNERALKMVANLKGISDQQLAAYKKYYKDITKNPEKLYWREKWCQLKSRFNRNGQQSQEHEK